MENEAFAHSGVIDVTLPESLEAIENRAFYECTALKWVRVEDPQDESGKHCFPDTKMLGINVSKHLTVGQGIFACN